MTLSKFCQKCGAEFQEGERFCPFCGRAATEVAEESAAPPSHPDGSLAEVLGVNEAPPARMSGGIADGRLVLRDRWFTAGYVVMFVLFVLPVVLAVVVAAAALLGNRNMEGPAVVLGIIAIPFAVGAYWGLVGMFNQTTLTVDTDTVAASHGPLPWRLGKRIDVSGIKTFRTVAREHMRRNAETFHTYAACAELNDGKVVTLYHGWDDNPERANFLVTCLSRFTQKSGLSA